MHKQQRTQSTTSKWDKERQIFFMFSPRQTPSRALWHLISNDVKGWGLKDYSQPLKGRKCRSFIAFNLDFSFAPTLLDCNIDITSNTKWASGGERITGCRGSRTRLNQKERGKQHKLTNFLSWSKYKCRLRSSLCERENVAVVKGGRNWKFIRDSRSLIHPKKKEYNALLSKLM